MIYKTTILLYDYLHLLGLKLLLFSICKISASIIDMCTVVIQ